MDAKLLVKAIRIALAASFIFGCACTSKKSTTPENPDLQPTIAYSPLNYGNSWTWEIIGSPVQEQFVDGDLSLGEPFEDLNNNTMRDPDEPYEDLNRNGQYDTPYDPWSPGIPYVDRNNNGSHEDPNQVWEPGELFLDLDGNGTCNEAEVVNFHASILYPNPQNGVMYRGSQFIGNWSDGQAGGQKGDLDGFSNDSLGLRWHSHFHRSGYMGDHISGCQPIILAQNDMSLGDSVIYRCSYSYDHSWISVFEAVENVTVPAGNFLNCLKFRSVASGWHNGLEALNGTSYQWYAKDVGLVKFEIPNEGEYWKLKSATVNGNSYP